MGEKRLIAYYGFPLEDTIVALKKKYPQDDWVDLDVDFRSPDSRILPKNYCRILRNIMDNALYLKDRIDCVITSTGAEKCEGGRYISFLLKHMGFNVVEIRNDAILNRDSKWDYHVPISKSGLPLVEKVELIMDSVINESEVTLSEVAPTHGFWGVPPHDFELLKLFPDTTHVYGWTRCVEARRPADIDLECHVDPGIPTVFFVQSFCAKSQLAKWLAEKHGGLFVDADGAIGMGIKSRIEAFLELSVPK